MLHTVKEMLQDLGKMVDNDVSQWVCALIYSKITKITSVDDMTQIMILGIQLYSSLTGMVTVFEQFSHLEYSDSYTCNIHGDPRIEGYHYCIFHSQGTACETLLALNYNSFILTVAIIGVGIYSMEAGWYNVIDSHSRDMYSEGKSVLLEIPSLHKIVQYSQTLHRNEHIYELRGVPVHIATFEPHLFSSNVENCSISNVNSYQCSCKQCCPIAVYAMFYSY